MAENENVENIAEVENRENMANNVLALDTINFNYQKFENMFIQVINRLIEYYQRDDINDSEDFAEKLISSRIRTTTKEELIKELKLTYLLRIVLS